MLIRFITENFLSFSKQVELSLIPGRGRLHPTHVVRDKRRNGISTLRTAVIYGPNASGKSNLIKAMSFARRLIVKGTSAEEQIDIKPFRLQKGYSELPSKFQFDFKHGNKIYSYGFVIDSFKVHEEWLFEIRRDKEKLLFERTDSLKNETIIKFGNLNYKNSREMDILEYIGLSTRPNQLFLNESIQRNVRHFKNVYDWFDKKLAIVFPDSIAEGIEFKFVDKTNEANIFLDYLRRFDTGISNLSTKRYILEVDKTEIPESIISALKRNLKEQNEGILLASPDAKKYTIFRNKHGDLIALKLISKHKIKGTDEEISFEINEESDGTQRIIDLIPALISSSEEDRVIVIDELDRSLHPLLIQEFLRIFFEECTKQKSQIIVSTHDASLLNQKLLRKDEIWFIEKDKFGKSSLFSLEEFKIRYDKNIQKDYLKGRFGAIPFFKN